MLCGHLSGVWRARAALLRFELWTLLGMHGTSYLADVPVRGPGSTVLRGHVLYDAVGVYRNAWFTDMRDLRKAGTVASA